MVRLARTAAASAEEQIRSAARAVERFLEVARHDPHRHERGRDREPYLPGGRSWLRRWASALCCAPATLLVLVLVMGWLKFHALLGSEQGVRQRPRTWSQPC